jgi:hypothetical protein
MEGPTTDLLAQQVLRQATSAPVYEVAGQWQAVTGTATPGR